MRGFKVVSVSQGRRPVDASYPLMFSSTSALCSPCVSCCSDQEIVALREELSVLNRLARAQDRKFEGSQGYALTRRLWLAEEELRLSRSTISALGAEVIRSLYVRSLNVPCMYIRHAPPTSPP